MHHRWFVVTLCLSLATGACTSSPPDATRDKSETTSAGCPKGPCIELTAPESGDTVRGGSVKIVTRVTGFELVDRIGKKARDGEGHIVYYRLESKGARIPTTPGKTALSGGSGTFTSIPLAETTYVWPETPGKYTPPGTYTFIVQLVNNDNTPLKPHQSAKVTVDVGA